MPAKRARTAAPARKKTAKAALTKTVAVKKTAAAKKTARPRKEAIAAKAGSADGATATAPTAAVPSKASRKKAVSGELPSVRVRMYRQGLGDCFLLTFLPPRAAGMSEAARDAAARHILIDCGTLGAKTTGNKLGDIVSHIASTTGKKLDVLIATHEHWDHVSGFSTQKDAFAAFDVDEVWMAWTENPQDELAKKVTKTADDLGAALGAAAEVLTRPEAADEARAVGMTLRSLLGFAGMDDEDGSAMGMAGSSGKAGSRPSTSAAAAAAAGDGDSAGVDSPGNPLLGAAGFKEGLDAAMTFVRTFHDAQVTYHKPEDIIEREWLPGFRFYVLGPPRSLEALEDLGDHGSSELYGMAAGLRSAAMFRAADMTLDDYWKLHASSGEADAVAQELPFDAAVRVESKDGRVPQWFKDSYLSETNAWRRVDQDWLLGASDLALQLDNMTNNTSLVLALERIADGKVLLLAADAQQGSWLSWHGGVHDLAPLSFKVKDASGAVTRTVSAADLLAKAVFYKVGHHASHNATARGKGLELMQRTEELTAFIPVDRQVALSRNPKGSWRMPAFPLYRALLDKCNGRVVRSDIGFAVPPEKAVDPKTEEAFLELAPSDKWSEWKKSQDAATHITVDKLFIDYLLD
jgi:hypothetical protein